MNATKQLLQNKTGLMKHNQFDPFQETDHF